MNINHTLVVMYIVVLLWAFDSPKQSGFLRFTVVWIQRLYGIQLAVYALFETPVGDFFTKDLFTKRVLFMSGFLINSDNKLYVSLLSLYLL